MQIIQVQNLSKIIHGTEILKDINLNVEKGKILAFLGPNGAGKTTTINILATLLKPTKGQVTIAGNKIPEESKQIREIIGYLQEDFSLYPKLSVFDNLDYWASLYGMPKNERINRIVELLDDFNLTEKMHSRPSTLSKGMIQKIGIIKSIVHRPRILFLDEPTSGLDPEIVEEIQVMLLDLKKEGCTMIITTHLLDRAEKISDNVVLISKGRVIASGDISDMKSRLRASDLTEIYHKLMVTKND
jgi:ABC-2 type transport system ATP-binding protein